MSVQSTTPDLNGTPAGFRTAARMMAQNWNTGAMTFVLPDSREIRLQGENLGPEARLLVRDYNFMNRTLRWGATGFGEGYMAGEWETPDLSTLLEVLALNFARFERVAFGNPLITVLNTIQHAFRGNSRTGSKRNIHAHYDLGNEFYARWLDATMT